MSREKEELDEFLLQHRERYDFGETSFEATFESLVRDRFLSPAAWEQLEPSDCRLRVLQCMRVLMRDQKHRTRFVEMGAVEALVGLCVKLADDHFQYPAADFSSEMIVETLSILKRFAALPELEPAAGTLASTLALHRALTTLLATRDALVLQCVLVALYQFVQFDHHTLAIGQLGCAEMLLRIVGEYEPSFKVLAAELLDLLLSCRSFFQDVVLHHGVSVLLSLLHTDDAKLPVPLLRAIDTLVADAACAKEVRKLGGINVLLSVLVAHSSGDRMPQTPVVVAVCSVLTTLALDDEAALQIRKANGVHLLGKLLFSGARDGAAGDDEPGGGTTACAPAPHAAAGSFNGAMSSDSGVGGAVGSAMISVHVFRTLRYLFSTERNRKVFRRLFPPDLFAAFIDVGHYVADLHAYARLAELLSALPDEGRAKVLEALDDINVIKGPSRQVREYFIQEMLGKGAFGCVYQVKKGDGERLYAMKELPADVVGAHGEEGAATGLEREVAILSSLAHPNIIRYFDSFQHDESLFIVMELVEGATLLDHLTSLAEKKRAMSERRIWQIFTQV